MFSLLGIKGVIIAVVVGGVLMALAGAAVWVYSAGRHAAELERLEDTIEAMRKQHELNVRAMEEDQKAAAEAEAENAKLEEKLKGLTDALENADSECLTSDDVDRLRKLLEGRP